MKIIYNKLIPFKGFYAINLFGIAFIRSEYNTEHYRRSKSHKTAIVHERIHTAQMKELLYVGFYILYFIEWLIRLFINNNAYKSISFEREAYDNEKDKYYLNHRKHYSWIRYIRNNG